ncbi:MAG: transcription elongation factor GreA, partial [Blastomonas fulva]|uniref:transcription elongation factor GreA n=1 Tax=Blastomonas fulva TaxID=1550728 RepID=UPI0040332022
MATVDKLPMLAEGYEKLSRELKLLKEERPLIVEAIEEARAHGDLSENAEYHAAKERQGQVEATIADLEGKLSRAQIIDPTTLSGNKVVFGATVTLLDEDDKPVKYQIVGEAEADARKGKISYSSPLGRALIGRLLDDEVGVSVPSGDKFYV